MIDRHTAIPLGFKKQLKAYADMVEKALPAFLPDKSPPWGEVISAMEYSLLGGGKRLRAALLLGFCDALGGDAGAALSFACAVEMVHAYSLIHDDLPCMDDSETRRGKPACHIRYGEAIALLAGDGLLTLAFDTVLRRSGNSAVPEHRIIRAAGLLSEAAGADGMIGGQVLDISGAGFDEVSIELMHLKKTGALIRASALMGCVLAGADDKIMRAADAYARNIGLAFQIVDDILDIMGNSSELGKPVGSDAISGKKTYISLYGANGSLGMASELISKAKAELASSGLESEFLCGLADMVISRKK